MDRTSVDRILEETIESFSGIRYAAYRSALKLRALSSRLQTHQIKLSTVRSVLRQHGYEAIYQNQTLLPSIELETLIADIYLSARREVPGIDQPEQNAEHLLGLLLKMYDVNQYGCIKLISAKIALALLASAPYWDKWKYILGELLDYNHCLSRKNAYSMLHDVARLPEILGEGKFFGTHLVDGAVESLWIRGRPSQAGLGEESFRRWLRDEPQTLVWLSTSYRIRQAEKLRHYVKCAICKAYPIVGLRYRCLRCYNYNMCQSCFLGGKTSKSHRLRHPLREYCTLVSAGQETKDLMKTLKNCMFQRAEQEEKPRYMPILLSSSLQSSLNMQSEKEVRAGSSALSTNPELPISSSAASETLEAPIMQRKDEEEIEVLESLTSSRPVAVGRSTSNNENVNNEDKLEAEQKSAKISRSASQPLGSLKRRGSHDGQSTSHSIGTANVHLDIITNADEDDPAPKSTLVSTISTEMPNFAVVDVIIPKLPPKQVEVYLPKMPFSKTTEGNPKRPNAPLATFDPPIVNGAAAQNTRATNGFSGLDYIDASPGGESRPFAPMPRGAELSINKSFVGKKTTGPVDEHGYAVVKNQSTQATVIRGLHPTYSSSTSHDQILTQSSSSPSPDSLANDLPSGSGHWNDIGMSQARKDYYAATGRDSWLGVRSTSHADSINHRLGPRISPFPVNSSRNARSDPSTPISKPELPARLHGVNGKALSSSVPSGGYHPILDQLEEKLRSLNTPLTPSDMRHPFWRHLKEKVENVFGHNSHTSSAVGRTYQSYPRLDNDYMHSPLHAGLLASPNLDVPDRALSGANQSPNESHSSGFHSLPECYTRASDEHGEGSVTTRFARSVPYVKSYSAAPVAPTHAKANEDLAQLDDLLQWLDDFKRSI